MCLLFSLLVICTPSNHIHALEKERIQLLMGTTACVRVWAADDTTADRAIDMAFDALTLVDRVMSIYKPNSEISKLNRTCPQTWTKTDPLLYDVLQHAIHIAQQTEGAFDPTVLPLMLLWGFYGEKTPQLPSPEAILNILPHIGYQHLNLHPHLPEIRFDTSGIQLDLGGIAKGYALDLAAKQLREANIQTAFLDIGGNLLLFGNTHKQTIGIQHPLHKDQLLGSIAIQNASVATSGGYEKFIDIHGQRYGHILDPRTGYPVSSLLCVTIVAPTATQADALSTALFVLGPQKAIAFLQANSQIDGVLVWQNNNQLYAHISPNLQPTFVSEDTIIQP